MIGVLNSADVRCNEEIAPGVYTRVTHFLPFVRNVLNGVKMADSRVGVYEFKRKILNVIGPKDINIIEN